ncbi:MAG: hypothetical protein ACOYMF_12395 [Bacteroidales bacterium]
MSPIIISTNHALPGIALKWFDRTLPSYKLILFFVLAERIKL